MLGKVDAVDFTNNSPFGNQYTTIDGVRYMTWWDAREVPVRQGTVVEYEASERKLQMGNSYEIAKCAKIKRVVAKE